ncbi:sigma 54-interacting transcriptional regulator [Sporolactobacillus vineae]|uniref:sigma 54-interacting transcriptional regulator n=1 Tax=Sporolactobacillus vineae TaxID=444463 RepID=UPI001313F3CF|nr:sigma 54-interacting transcriptional regulator [Sporolactobacillus vineae]
MTSKDSMLDRIVSGYSNGLIERQFTTASIQKLTGQKRNLVSHYLNRLVEEKKLNKKDSRPVCYSLSDSIIKNARKVKNSGAFSEFIGASGSLRKQIGICQAAVDYPTNGLPIILSGSSGTGKSFLAKLIYQFACDERTVAPDSPFITLNCADYANNPELMSDMLFGHKKGAFTGAIDESTGLLDQANGGFLFLDEVHRLSLANQEKLFLFLDQGKFRRLGENKLLHSSDVRFIFATTENIEDTFLETFRRRIPLKVTLPSFLSRPLMERDNIVHRFFYDEAVRLHRVLWVTQELYKSLLFFNGKGNIGSVKSEVKVLCAEAYSNQSGHSDLMLMNENERLTRVITGTKSVTPEKLVKIDPSIHEHDGSYDHHEALANSKDLMESFNKDMNVNLLNKSLNSFFIKKYGENYSCGYYFIYLRDCVHESLIRIGTQTGLKFDEKIKQAVFLLVNYFLNYETEKLFSKNHMAHANQLSKADLLAKKIIKNLEIQFNITFNQNTGELLTHYLSLLFHQSNYFSDNDIQGIVVAHGESTASSIASVANRLCGGYLFESFDMPLESDTKTVINKVNHFLTHVETKLGVIVLVDMGSLTDLYEPIKAHLQGDLLIINNITTSMAIDVGMKIKNQVPMKTIIHEADSAYTTKIRYYEGLSMNDNIIVSCISGIGIAKKISHIIKSYLQADDVDVVTIGYLKLKKMFAEHKYSMFRKTRFIISTTPLDTGDVPFLTVHQLIRDDFHDILKHYFSGLMNENNFYHMIDDIVKLFTVKGAASRLKFLNPVLVVNEIEDIIHQFEAFYDMHFQSYVKMNLFLHISSMIERLIIGEKVNGHVQENVSRQQSEFCDLSDEVFKKVTKKYHIVIPVSEKLMIFEIIKMNFGKGNP